MCPPALGLFVQPTQLCNYFWCMRRTRACFAHGLGGKKSFGGDGGTFAVIQAEEEDMEENGEVCTCGMETSTGNGRKRDSGADQNKARLKQGAWGCVGVGD